jgi:AcrR family transcriptional regulator
MQTKSLGAPTAAAPGSRPAEEPLYERLPRGPHRLARADVLAHQRERIQGAMASAVATSGFHATSVRQVILLAGVSRRSFYEHYANREDCFLATFDALAARTLAAVEHAFKTSGGDRERRLRAALAAFTASWREDPGAIALLAHESQGAGRRALVRLRAATVRCGRLLGRARPQGAASATIAQVIAGGLQGAVAGAWRRGGDQPPGAIEPALTRWVLLRGAADEPLPRAGAPLPAPPRGGELPAAAVPGTVGGQAAEDSARTRLTAQALRLGALGAGELTGAEIAEGARLPVEAFLERFRDPGECYLAGLEQLAETARATIAAAVCDREDPHRAVRLGVAALLGHLARHTLHAHTLGHAAFAVSGEAADTNVRLARRLVTALAAPAAPTWTEDSFFLDALSGALLHLVGCQALRGRLDRLPALAGPFAAVVLAAAASGDGG